MPERASLDCAVIVGACLVTLFASWLLVILKKRMKAVSAKIDIYDIHGGKRSVAAWNRRADASSPLTRSGEAACQPG